jgi:hypothetical protein
MMSHSIRFCLTSIESYLVLFRTLNKLLERARASPYLDLYIAEYRLNFMIMGVAHHRLFKPPQVTNTPPESCRQLFLNLRFLTRE